MNREILFKSLKENLSGLTLDQFARLFINEVDATEEFYKLCHNINAGKTISLLFNPHRLATGTKKDELSVYSSLQYDDRVSGLARLYLYNLEHGVNDAFYQAIQRGYQNIQYVNEFPPFVARSIYLRYKNSDNLKILDPCAGWGGRMIGAASIPNTYYEACEPCTETYDGLLKLGKWLKLLQPSFEFKVHKLPYEEFDTNTLFDIALTSPPYYDTEHYSDEETNSLNRYQTFEDWVESFYKPLILNTVDRLTIDGVFILNVGDRLYPLSEKLKLITNENGFVCNRIKDYLSGNGEGKEKFYCVSKINKFPISKKLF